MTTETVTGEVRQVVRPGEEPDYFVGETQQKMFDEGYSGVTIYFDEMPLTNQVLSNSVFGGLTAIVWMPLDHMFGIIPDPDDFSRRVWLRDPDFDVGDEVTVLAEETVIHTETALVAGDSR